MQSKGPVWLYSAFSIAAVLAVGPAPVQGLATDGDAQLEVVAQEEVPTEEDDVPGSDEGGVRGAAIGADEEQALVDAYVTQSVVDSLPEGVDTTDYLPEEDDRGLPMDAQSSRDEVLNATERQAYDKLLADIKSIADGKRSSTKFSLKPKELLGTDTLYSADLGVDIKTCTYDELDRAFWDRVMRMALALKNDYPHLFYWDYWGGTHGMNARCAWTYNRSKGRVQITSDVEYLFRVQPKYRVTHTDEYSMKSPVATRVATAIATAQAIAAEHASLAPAYRLLRYMQEVCTRNRYNWDAAELNTADQRFAHGYDDQQLIDVFDGDSTTNVVCAGYAKALKYLCDLSGRTDIECRYVSGANSYTTQGALSTAGSHAWNVVRMDDGRSYLVDPTNADYEYFTADGLPTSNDAVYNPSYFLVPPLSYVDGTYYLGRAYSGGMPLSSDWSRWVDPSPWFLDGYRTLYDYDEWTKALNSAEFLTLSEAAYGEADRRSIGFCDVELAYGLTGYDGTRKKPGVTVTYQGLVTLREGTDYSVSYKNNLNPGTATVTITGKGAYTGKREATFKIGFFCDVDPDDTVNHGFEVDWMGRMDISTGWEVADGYEYRGLKDVARCDFAAFVYRLGDLMDDGARNDSIALPGARVSSVLATVSDCDAETSHAAEIAWLIDSGISRGWSNSDGTVAFRPMDKVARQDMAAFLYRFADLRDDGRLNASLAQGAQAVVFSDVRHGDETNHASEVEWLASVGVTKGWEMSDGSYQFRGRTVVKRQDMAAFMYRLHTYLTS